MLIYFVDCAKVNYFLMILGVHINNDTYVNINNETSVNINNVNQSMQLL